MALAYQLSMLSPVATLSASTPAQRAIAVAISSFGTLLTALVTSLGVSAIGGSPDIIGRLHRGNERLQFDQWRFGPRMRLRKEISGRPRRAIDCPPSRASVRPHHLQHISTITLSHYRLSTRFCRRDSKNSHCGMNCQQVAEMASWSRAARSSLNRVRRLTLSMLATSSALSSPLLSICRALVTSAGPILRRRPPIRPFALPDQLGFAPA
jgi:hypothetical protein